MKMRYAIVIIVVVVSALQAHAQGVPCATDERPDEKHSTNQMMIFFQPSLADSTIVRIYDDSGTYVDEPLVAPEVKGKPATYEAAESFYPAKRYLATPDSTQCVQGKARREKDHAPCQAWFQMNLKQASPTQPFDIVIEAPSEVGVTLQVAKGDGRCTRTVNAKNVENVFASETVSLAFRRNPAHKMPPPGCSADVLRRDANGNIPVTEHPRSGQSGFAPSLNGADAVQCKQVKVRVLK